MHSALLNGGKDAGFSVVEVFEQKVERQALVLFHGYRAAHQVNTDRAAVRAFMETGAPLTFSVSQPSSLTGRAVGRLFTDLRALTTHDPAPHFAARLPIRVEKRVIDIIDEAVGDPLDEQCRSLQQRIDAALAADPAMRLQRLYFSRKLQRTYLSNSLGLAVKSKRTRFDLELTFLHEGHQLEVRQNHTHFADLAPEKLVSAAGFMLRSLGDVPPPAETECLVFTPEAAAFLLREFSTLFKAGSPAERRKMIADTAVTVLEDPFLDRQPGSTAFDDEGVQVGEKVVVNKGMLLTPLTDLHSAFRLKLAPTGNGFRDNQGLQPGIRFSNLYIKPSVFGLKHLLHEAGRGVLVTLVKVKAIGRERDERLLSLFGYRFDGDGLGAPVGFYCRTAARTVFMHVEKVSRELSFFFRTFNVGAPHLLIRGRFDKQGIFEI